MRLRICFLPSACIGTPLTMLACILLADLPFGKLTLILLVDLHVAVHFTVLT